MQEELDHKRESGQWYLPRGCLGCTNTSRTLRLPRKWATQVPVVQQRFCNTSGTVIRDLACTAGSVAGHLQH